MSRSPRRAWTIPQTTEAPSVGAVRAWASPSEDLSRDTGNLRLLRAVMVAGGVLGHRPGRLLRGSKELRFSFVSWGTAVFVFLSALRLYIRFYIETTSDTSADWTQQLDTATYIAETLPGSVNKACSVALLAFALVRAPVLSRLLQEVASVARDTPSFPVRSQVLALLAGLAFVAATICRYVGFTHNIFRCVGFHAASIASAAASVFHASVTTWFLELYMQVVLFLRLRTRHLKDATKDVLDAARTTRWSDLNPEDLERVTDEHRRTSQLATRFLQAMAPVLLLVLVASFVETTCGSHTFLINVLPSDSVGGVMTSLEVAFLAADFLLTLAVCHVSGTFGDEWDGIGKQMTAVPLRQVTEQVRRHLLTFLRQLPDLTPVATAAGFFVISRSFVVGMTNCMATYLVFMVQFHDAADKQNLTYGYHMQNQSCS